MALDTYPKTVPRPTAIQKFKALLPEKQLKRLKTQRDIASRLVTAFKHGTIDRELEHLGYPVVTKYCTSSNIRFYVVGYRAGNEWQIISVMTVTEYEEITQKLRDKPMVIKLIGGNIHTKS